MRLYLNELADSCDTRVADDLDRQVQNTDAEDVGLAGERAEGAEDILSRSRFISRAEGGTVRLSAEEVEGELWIEVSDEGPGFPLDFVPTAFDRFTRAESSRTTPGTGLGLAIVAAIAEAHGGTAEIGTWGGGATATISLPRPRPRD